MALVLNVVVNGQRFTIAGESSLSVLSAHVSAVGHLGPNTQNSHRWRADERDIDLRVSGLTGRGDRRKDEHLRWGKRLALKSGDQVVITIEESEAFDRPTSRSSAHTGSTHGIGARRRWANARSLYFRLKDRFAGRAQKADELFRRQTRKADAWWY